MIIFTLCITLGTRLVLEMTLQRVGSTIHSIAGCERNFVLVELILDKLVSIAQLGKLYFLLFDYERRQPPFPLFLIPFSAVLDLIHLLVGHEVLRYLLEEVQFFCLLPDSVKQFLIALRILTVNVL